MRFSASGATNMNQKNSLSAIVIAKNEALRIGTCLDALTFCDESFVADNGSIDETIGEAKKHHARVVAFHEEDFAALRNAAAKSVHSEWILYVDADEVISPELAEAIRKTVNTWRPGDPLSYRLHRTNYYLGKRWPVGEWMLRLFKQDALKRWEGELHETAVTKGRVGQLTGEIMHDTHRSLEEMVAKTNEWSETEAALRLAAHHPPISWWRLIRVMITGFWQSFVGQGGWRTGTVGWIESIYQGFSLFITYAKLWEMQQKK